MMLQTKLKHLNTADELKKAIAENENVMVCCGRMGPMCIPVYAAMELLEPEYKNVAFRDFPFDSPEADVIRKLPECRDFRGLPFTVYYKKGKVVKATTSIQSKAQIKEILDANYKA